MCDLFFFLVDLVSLQVVAGCKGIGLLDMLMIHRIVPSLRLGTLWCIILYSSQLGN